MTQAQLMAEFKSFLASKGAVAPKAKRTKAEVLAAKDKAIKTTFTKRGVKNVVLAPRNAEGKIDLTAEFNVRPYKGWTELGRQVRTGEKAVRGMFHETQLEPLTK